MTRPSFPQTADLQLSVETLRLHMQINTSTEGILQNFLPKLFGSASQLFTSFVQSAKFNGKELMQLIDKEKRSLSSIEKMNYEIIRHRPLDTMEGFTGSYKDYSGVVLVGLGFYEDVLDEELRAYKMLLGDLLTNKTAQLSLKDLAIDSATRVAQERAQAPFWTRGSFASRGTLGDVVGSLSEFSDLYLNMAAIAKKATSAPLDNVLARVSEVNALVTILADTLKTDEMKNISRTQITNLSEGILNLARNVEHYSIQCYRAQVFITAVKRLDAVATGQP